MATNTSFILLSLFIVFILKNVIACLLFINKCVTHCPRLMHSYHTRCDRDTLSQRTCDDPMVYSIGFTCGWSRCDCNGNLLLEENTGACVDIMTCLLNKNIRRRARPSRAGKISKKLKFKEDLDITDQI